MVFRRHSGEGRNPEPGRAAANGCSRSIHARFHGFAGAVREPPVLKAWVGNPAIVRLVGAGGAFPNDPYGMFARRLDADAAARTTTGGCPCDCRNRRARRHRRPANGAQEGKRSRASPAKLSLSSSVGDAYMRPAFFPFLLPAKARRACWIIFPRCGICMVRRSFIRAPRPANRRGRRGGL